MIEQGFGRIINLSSVAGLAGSPGQAHYAASKAAIVGLTVTLAKEYAAQGITVNAIAPGFVHTDLTSEVSGRARDAIRENTPLGRPIQADEVAFWVLALASPKASGITGQVIVVDGDCRLMHVPQQSTANASTDTSAPDGASGAKLLLLVSAIAALGFGLRVHLLDTQSFWYDRS
jgi:enoyl-[acyl-carrier-protein] reductase (NADH)